MNTSGVNMPPEWLDTTKAPPAGGMFGRPRTSARYHRLTTGATTLRSCLVNEGSHLAISGPSAAVSLIFPAVVEAFFDLRIWYSRFLRMSYPHFAVPTHAGGRWPRRSLSQAVS